MQDFSQILSSANQIRRQVRLYFFWQVFWATFFLFLVFVSSIFLGMKNPHFWIYLIIPLIVIGGFWVFIQTAKQNAQIRLNQQITKIVVNHFFEDLKFIPFYKITKDQFIKTRIFRDVYNINSRNAIVGNINNVPFTMAYIWVEKNSNKGIIVALSGLFIQIDINIDLPFFAIYPRNYSQKPIDDDQFVKLKTKLDSDFQVWAKDAAAKDVIEILGPHLLKFSHLCSKPEHFYFSSFNGKIYIGIFNDKDVMQFPLFRPISDEDIKEQINFLQLCLSFFSKIIHTLDNE